MQVVTEKRRSEGVSASKYGMTGGCEGCDGLVEVEGVALETSLRVSGVMTLSDFLSLK